MQIVIRNFLIANIVLLSSNELMAHLPNDTTIQNKGKFKTLLGKTSNQSDNIITGKIEVNKQQESFNAQYLGREKSSLSHMRSWGSSYFTLYDKVLTQYGIPTQLKYLSVIESSLNPLCRSWAGAVGPWQLMYDEAMRFGLRVTNNIDERTDYQKSTVAAAKLLSELHHQFGDWLLVLAAYNAGPGALRKAIRKANSNDFWKLQYFLPTETRNHVKRFISTHYFFEGNGSIATMTKSESENYTNAQIHAQALSPEEAKTMRMQEVKGFYNSQIVAQSLQMQEAEFDRLNPNFNKTLANGATYQLKLSKALMEIFEQNKKEILERCFQQLLH